LEAIINLIYLFNDSALNDVLTNSEFYKQHQQYGKEEELFYLQIMRLLAK
jgi:hypothetical protein